jgi:hypothetical protein
MQLQIQERNIVLALGLKNIPKNYIQHLKSLEKAKVT